MLVQLQANETAQSLNASHVACACLSGLLVPGSDNRYNTAWNSVEHLCRANAVASRMRRGEESWTCGLDGDEAVRCRCLDEHQDDVGHIEGWCNNV